MLISKIIELESDKSHLTGRTISSERQMADFKDSLNGLRAELESREEQLEQLTAELEQTQNETTRLKEQLESKDRMISDEDIEERE